MPVTVGHNLVATTPDDPAYEIRPSHWNDTHAVTLSAAGSEIIGAFSNANGVSFGLSAGSVTASYTQSTHSHSSLSFDNGNGVTFGLAGSTLTASVQTAYQSQGAYLTTAALSNHSHGNPSLALTNISGTTASNSAGFTLSLSANVGGGGDGGAFIAAGTRTAGSNSTVLFSNANNFTFGLDAINGSVITASFSESTHAHSAFVLSDSNGLAWGTNGSTVTGSYSQSTHSHATAAFSAANGSFTANTVSFSNLNGVSFGTSAGGAITASHNGLTTARASNDAVGLNTALTAGPLAWTVNSSGISLNAGGAAGTTTGFAGNQISGSMTHNTAGLNISLNHPAWLTTAAQSNHSHGNPTLNLTNLSGTTASNSAGFTLSLSAAAPGGGAAINVSAGTTSGNVQTLQFDNGNGVSFGLNGSTVTASVNGGGGDGGIFGGVSNLGNTAGSTGVVSTGNFVLVGSNGITLSQSTGAAGSAATITILGPQRTISALMVPPFGGMAGGIPFAQSSFSMGQNSLYMIPFQIEDHLSADHVKLPVMATNSSSAAASVQKGLTYIFGLYTRVNATQISRHYSSSYTIAASHNSNASWMLSMITAIGNSTSYNTLSASSAGLNLSASLHGPRELIIPISSMLTPGEYWAALVASTSSVGAGGAVLNISNVGIAAQTYNRPGLSTATSNRAFYNDVGMGLYSATTGAMPASIGMTQINNMGSQPLMFFCTGTV